jgi:hypothetical protein
VVVAVVDREVEEDSVVAVDTLLEEVVTAEDTEELLGAVDTHPINQRTCAVRVKIDRGDRH